jgi:uncharacterized membrane protein YdbT with pleckstrin-like domain
MPPKGYIERMLGEQEKILLVTRQHWFVVLGAIFIELLMILGIIVATILAAIFIPVEWGVLKGVATAIGILLLLFPIVTLTYDIMVWYNRQYIVTNRRVVQISGIINKNVTDSSLEKVNDVKLAQSALGRIFGYGDVEILTASELGVNLFKRIEDPIRFKTAMLNAKEKLERGEDLLTPRSGNVPAMIEQLDKLRQQGILTEEEFQAKKAELLAKI